MATLFTQKGNLCTDEHCSSEVLIDHRERANTSSPLSSPALSQVGDHRMLRSCILARQAAC